MFSDQHHGEVAWKKLAQENDINYHTLSKRLNSGMSLETALTIPHSGFKEHN